MGPYGTRRCPPCVRERLVLSASATSLGGTRSYPVQGAASLLEHVGRIAVASIGILIAAGGVFAIYLVGSLDGLPTSRYGPLLVAKVTIVGALLGLAALNKLRFVPELAKGNPIARRHLDRSILAEGVTFLVICAVTATLTTVAVPPTGAH